MHYCATFMPGNSILEQTWLDDASYATRQRTWDQCLVQHSTEFVDRSVQTPEYTASSINYRCI